MRVNEAALEWNRIEPIRVGKGRGEERREENR